MGRLELAACALVACSALGAAGASCGGDDPPRDRHVKQPRKLDWRRGSYEGVRLGATLRTVVRRRGRPVRRGINQEAAPTGGSFSDIGGPAVFGAPKPRRAGREDVLRYARLAYFIRSDGVYGWVTIEARAQTPEGVGVGDDLGVVRRRYARARCDDGDGSEYETAPECTVVVCAGGRALVFGGDPIRSVWLLARRRRGLSRCR